MNEYQNNSCLMDALLIYIKFYSRKMIVSIIDSLKVLEICINFNQTGY